MARTKFGLVAVVDVLGGKERSANEPAKFLRDMRQLIADARAGMGESVVRMRKQYEKAERSGISVPDPTFSLFGDTIVLSWEVPRDAPQTAVQFSGMLSPFMALALARGLPLRGSVSLGDYVVSNSGVLGHAVSDCASWYDRVNWIGVVAAPQFGGTLAWLRERILENKRWIIDQQYVEYGVPLKGVGVSQMWALAWPLEYLLVRSTYNIPIPEAKGGTPPTPRERFLDSLRMLSVPFGTEEKYANTVKYFDWYADKHEPQLRKPMAHLVR